MQRILPKPKSPYWLALGAGLSALSTLLYLVFFIYVFHRYPAYLNIPGIILIFSAFSLLIALGGYLNFPLFLGFSSAGFIFGLGLFISMLGNPVGGFEDLVGAMSFLMLSVLGIAVGIVAELARFGWKKLKEKQSDQ